MSANTSSHTADETAIRSVLSAYEEAMNASNTEAVMPLYTDDGVFMPPNNRSAVGKAAVRQSLQRGVQSHHPEREVHGRGACHDVA